MLSNLTPEIAFTGAGSSTKKSKQPTPQAKKCNVWVRGSLRIGLFKMDTDLDKSFFPIPQHSYNKMQFPKVHVSSFNDAELWNLAIRLNKIVSLLLSFISLASSHVH